jgi:hypothetical protein
VDQIDKDVATITKPTLVGGAVGSIRSLGPGTFVGAGVGALAGLAKVLFTRGDEIHLPAGTTVEMVLQRPLTLDLSRTKKVKKCFVARKCARKLFPYDLRVKPNIGLTQ